MIALPDKAVLTVAETAKVLRIGRSSAYVAARRGELPTIKLGRRLLVPTAKLAELLGEPKSNAPVVSRGAAKTSGEALGDAAQA